MYIGGGIALLVVGAVLAFAVTDQISGVDLTVLGYICMAGGALAIILSLVLQQRRNNTSHRTVVERHDYDDTPPPPPRY